MGRLIYTGNTSLDGYTVDANGDFDFTAPDEDVHAFINDRERSTTTYLYGRRLYDTMKVWQDIGHGTDDAAVMVDYAQIWRGADKVVYSRNGVAITTPRTVVRPTFDPISVRRILDEATTDVSIGGATLAAEALRAGLVDEIRQLVTPHVVGGGTPFLPDGIRFDLDLVDEHRFAGGTVYLAYRVRH